MNKANLFSFLAVLTSTVTKINMDSIIAECQEMISDYFEESAILEESKINNNITDSANALYKARLITILSKNPKHIYSAFELANLANISIPKTCVLLDDLLYNKKIKKVSTVRYNGCIVKLAKTYYCIA